MSESECVGVSVWECVGVWEGECVGVWETGEDTRGVGRGDCNWRVSAQPVVRPHADTTPVETGLCTRQTLLRVVDTLKVEFRNPALHAPNPPARVQKHTPSVHKSSLNAISAVLCGPWRLGGESFLRPSSSVLRPPSFVLRPRFLRNEAGFARFCGETGSHAGSSSNLTT